MTPEYEHWQKKAKRNQMKATVVEVVVICVIFAVGIAVGMGAQYYRDAEIREIAATVKQNAEQAINEIQAMPAQGREMVSGKDINAKGGE